jgi:omega-6 fatty acid desaturase (delta-12 desaturase)
MTATFPHSSYTLTEDTTLRDIIKTLPPECFTKNNGRAWLGVITSVVAAGLGYVWLAHAPWYILPLAWLWTGTALTGWFVIGHDCGHRSFAKSLWVNDLVGHIAFLPLLYPFHCWRLKHDHHHLHTNKMGEDNAWYPFTDAVYDACKGCEQVAYRLIRRRFWWLGSILHWFTLHFDPQLYPERQRRQVQLSIAVVVIFAVTALPTLVWWTGVWGLVKFWLMPWLVYHFWMSTFTIVHHTMPDIPFKYPEEWNAVQAQLRGTVHCDYPQWIEWLCHDINVHIPHHISTGIPFYNLRLAHQSLEKNWGQYLYKTKFSWELMREISDKCHIFDQDKCYRSFQEMEDSKIGN